MAELCKCGESGILNTGLPLCIKLQKAIRKLIFVNLVKPDGTLTSVDPAATLDKAWMDALLNNINPALRWFPTPQIENVEFTKDADVVETYTGGGSSFISESVSRVAFLLPKTPPMYKRVFDSIKCATSIGVYMVDKEGNLIGVKGSDGKLYPLPISTNSLSATVVWGGSTNTQGLNVSFEFLDTFNEADMWMISSGAFTGFNLLTIAGLRDGEALVSNITLSGFDVTLTTPSSALNDPIKVQGLTLANFTLKEVSPTPGTIAITSVTEVTPGVYKLVFPAQTAGDKLSLVVTAPNYDFATVASQLITLP